MHETARNVLAHTLRDWAKFIAEKEKMEKAAHQVAEVAIHVILELLKFLKTHHVDTNAESADTMAMMGSPVRVVAEVDATYPAIKTLVRLTCADATRSIVVHPNLTVSAGGAPFPVDLLSKGVPQQFVVNAAEFLRDAFPSAARAVTAREQVAQSSAS